MEHMMVIIGTLAAIGVVGLAWIGGYQVGASQINTAQSARPTVSQLIDDLNTRRPKAAKNRRKAARKAVRV